MFFIRWSVVYFIVLFVISLKTIECNIINSLEHHSVFYGVVHLSNSESSAKDGSLCYKQMSEIAKGVRKKNRWALKLFDASGVPETRLNYGNTYWLGSRTQCLAAERIEKIPVTPSSRMFVETNETITPFPVAYFGLYLHHNSTMQLVANTEKSEFVVNIGLCLPKSCSKEEVYNIAEKYFKSKKLTIQTLYDMDFEIDSVKKMETDYSWTKENRFKVFIYSILGTIVLSIFATIYDVKRKNNNRNPTDSNEKDETQNTISKGETKKDSIFVKVLLCFSLYKNSVSFFDGKLEGEGQKFQILFGIRVLLSAWIIMSHTLYYTMDLTFNTLIPLINFHIFLKKLFSSAVFIVDSFFTMSGFLMGYSMLDMEMKKTENKPTKQRNFIQKIYFIIFAAFGRFLRLTPTYMVALGFTEFLLKWRYNETFYWISARETFNCEKNWWRNLLYINNFYPRLELCMGWSWYLSVDMQLFLICIAILVFTSTKFKASINTLLFFLVITNFYASYIGYISNYNLYVDSQSRLFEIVYQVPWFRISPYAVGIIAGLLLRKYEGRFEFTKTAVISGWLVCLAIFGILMFAFDEDNTGPIVSALHIGWSKTFWAMATSWCLVACLTNNGGVLTKMLTLKIWTPLARATYSTYLLHPIIMLTFLSFRESAWEISLTNVLVYGFGYVTLSFMFSVIFCIVFESPLRGITKLLIEAGKSSIQDKKPPINNNNDINVKLNQKKST